MSIEIIETGGLFTSKAQTLVNTVNCMGVMGKGIALQFKSLYPEMYQQYVAICQQGLLDIGKLWLYKTEEKWILNFPTKKDWRYPSKEIYIIKGLNKFTQTYKQRGITSVAFPLLGSSNGKLDPKTSLKIMTRYLSTCDIPVFIYLNRVPY